MPKRDVTVRIKEVYVRTTVFENIDDSISDEDLQLHAHTRYANGVRLSEPSYESYQPLDTWDVWRGAPREETGTV